MSAQSIFTHYTPFFCEENIWHLAVRMLAGGEAAETLSVLVLCNPARQVPLFAQRAGRPEDGLVVWDYHVILRQAMAADGLIFDYDSRLSFPSSFKTYRFATFPDTCRLPPAFRPLVRIIPATAWLRHFSSDRSHMRDAAGNPLQPFPPWPSISPPDGERRIDLQEYLNMRRALGDGSRVCGVDELEPSWLSGSDEPPRPEGRTPLNG